jgi:hypothetical protein
MRAAPWVLPPGAARIRQELLDINCEMSVAGAATEWTSHGKKRMSTDVALYIQSTHHSEEIANKQFRQT